MRVTNSPRHKAAGAFQTTKKEAVQLMTTKKWGGILLLTGLALFTSAAAYPRTGVFLFTLALAFCAARLFETADTTLQKAIFTAVPLIPSLLLFVNGPLFARILTAEPQKLRERLAVLAHPIYRWLLVGLMLGLWLMPAAKAFAKTAPKCVTAVLLVLAELLVLEPFITAIYHMRFELYGTMQMHQLVPLLIGLAAGALYKVMRAGELPLLRKTLCAVLWVVFAVSMVHSWFAAPGWGEGVSFDFWLNIPFATGTLLGVLYALPAEAD